MIRLAPVLGTITAMIIAISFIFSRPVYSNNYDINQILKEYKEEYELHKQQVELEKKVDEIISSFPIPPSEDQIANQRYIAQRFYQEFNEYTAKTALAVAKGESGYRSNAFNGHNTNGTTDSGCWQINSIHNLTNDELFDCKKSTEWAIQKVKRDNGFWAWVAYQKLRNANSI